MQTDTVVSPYDPNGLDTDHRADRHATTVATAPDAGRDRKRSLSDKTARHLTGSILLAALLAMVALVARSPHHFIFDETYFVQYLVLIHRYGFTPTFLRSLNAAPGPLSTVVQVLFEPLTRLQPVETRFVNVLATIAMAFTVAASLKDKEADSWVAGFSVLVVPMTWVVGGMELTEISAMVFVSLSLLLLLRGLHAFYSDRPALAWFVFAGACLGISVWGRQPYLLLAGVPVLLALADRRLVVPAAVFCVVATGIPAPLFVIWRGFVAPSQHLHPGFSLVHGLLSFAYAGLCFLLLGARSRWLPLKWAAGLVTATVVTNVLLGGFAISPFRSLAERYLSTREVTLYGNLAGSVFLSFGVLSVAALLRLMWESRNRVGPLAIYAGLFCVAAAPLLDTHQYSSRYTAMCAPYLVLASQPWRTWRPATVLLALVGCALGFLSLHEYFVYAH